MKARSSRVNRPESLAEKNDLHLVLGLGCKVQLRKVGTQPWEAVVEKSARQHLQGHTRSLVCNKLGQVRVVHKYPKEVGWNRGPAAIKVERQKFLQTRQRRQVRHARAG
jgi:hypothetical protein